MTAPTRQGRTMDPTIKALAAVKREIPKIVLGAPEDARLLVIDMAQAELQKLRADALYKQQEKMDILQIRSSERIEFGSIES